MKFASKFVALLILVGVSVVAPVANAASALPHAKPAEVGLSPERLDRISGIIQNDVDTREIAGATAMIIRNGKIGYYENFGHADREKKIPMKDDTLFRIYSMSKPITSVALMSLFEEGKFFLDDPVSKYIPELGNLRVVVDPTDRGSGPTFNLPSESEANAPSAAPKESNLETVPANRDITIRDLLRHTAGLTYGFFGNTDVDKAYQELGILLTDRNLADMVAKVGKTPLLFQPGERWHYSISVDVQGRLVEVLSGKSFDVFLQERIFEPLGMTDTGFYAPKEKLSRLSKMYTPSQEGGIEPAPEFMSRNFVAKPALFSGGGGLVSSTGDYARFCQMLLNGGTLDGHRILSRTTIELMTKDHCQTADIGMRSGGNSFGLGFQVALDQGRSGSPVSEGTYSWGGAAGTKFWIDPKEDLIGIYMVQTLPHIGTFGEVFKNMVYQSIDD
ncbi:MAG: serine hydrolase domain-containing protein [Candidatus Hydrogenedentota bacterium]